MSEESIAVLVEIALGVITVPWCIWVTRSIFSLQKMDALQAQKVELWHEELKSVQRIEKIVQKMRKGD